MVAFAFRFFADEIRQHITADDEEAFIQESFCVPDAPGGPQVGFCSPVFEVHAKGRAVSKIIGNDLRLVEEGCYDVLDTMGFQKAHDVRHHGLVDHRNHRLRNVARERP